MTALLGGLSNSRVDHEGAAGMAGCSADDDDDDDDDDEDDDDDDDDDERR